MSLAVAVPLGTASAVVYGISIVVQHGAAHTGTGEEDARGLLRLLKDPRWLLAIGGDVVGFALQIGALSTGPVVLVQPLVVLMLPVALITASLMGGPRPRASDYLSMVMVIGGLTALHRHGRSRRAIRTCRTRTSRSRRVHRARSSGRPSASCARGRGANLRGAVYGAVAGACFGTLGVMVNLASHRIVDGKITSLVTHASGHRRDRQHRAARDDGHRPDPGVLPGRSARRDPAREPLDRSGCRGRARASSCSASTSRPASGTCWATPSASPSSWSARSGWPRRPRPALEH